MKISYFKTTISFGMILQNGNGIYCPIFISRVSKRLEVRYNYDVSGNTYNSEQYQKITKKQFFELKKYAENKCKVKIHIPKFYTTWHGSLELIKPLKK